MILSFGIKCPSSVLFTYNPSINGGGDNPVVDKTLLNQVDIKFSELSPLEWVSYSLVDITCA